MKKVFKIGFITIISLIVVINVVDLVAIYFNKKPLIVLGSKDGEVYYGLFYNTYNCNGKVCLKWKTTRFNCPVVKEYTIVDKTKEMGNFSCPEILDEIYRNEDYSYNLTCQKGSYVVVKYKNGQEETVKEALNNHKIAVKDLDLYEIDYVKVPLKHDPLDTSSETTNPPHNKPSSDTKPSTGSDTQIINPGIDKKPITPPETGSTTAKKILVIDKSSGQYCAQAIEYFYQNYYFTCVKSHSVYVSVDGQEYLLKYALNNGIVTMKELEAAGYKFNKNNNYNYAVK